VIERETVGKAECANCGAKVTVKRNIKGHLYYNCSWGDGGCGCQFQSRTNDADAHVLKRLNKSEKQSAEKPAVKVPQEGEQAQSNKVKEKSYLDYMA